MCVSVFAIEMLSIIELCDERFIEEFFNYRKCDDKRHEDMTRHTLKSDGTSG